MKLQVFELTRDMTPEELESFLDNRLYRSINRNVQLNNNVYNLDDGTVIAYRLSLPDKIGIPPIFDEDERAAVINAIEEIAEDIGSTIEI